VEVGGRGKEGDLDGSLLRQEGFQTSPRGSVGMSPFFCLLPP